MIDNGVRIRSQPKAATGKLLGAGFVFTGELESMTRDEAKELVRRLGGTISESVSKQTSFVVVGREPGSKHAKAKKLGVKIMNEKEFLAFIKKFL